MELIWQAVLAAAGALVVLQFQLGSRRGRQRRELLHELELLEKLGPEHAAPRERLAARIHVLLERYEPPPKPEPGPARQVSDVAIVVAGLLLLALAIFGFDLNGGRDPSPSVWVSRVLFWSMMVTFGIAVAASELARRDEQKKVDAQVIKGQGQGVAPTAQAEGFGTVTDQSPPATESSEDLEDPRP